MLDGCGRTIDYLRLSVTDLCNYRCRYCMPAEGVCKRSHADILSVEELQQRSGVSKSVIELLEQNGALHGLSKTNQITFF